MTASQLREFRRAKGWTQAEMASRTGYSGAAIAQMETGVRRVSLRLRLVLEAYGAPPVPRGLGVPARD